MLLSLLADQPPTDFWHDPLTLTIIGGIITIIGALIGAGITYFIFRKQTSKKLISYQVVSNAPIANFNNTSKNTVEIKINTRVVTNPRQVVLKLRNQGNVAINTGDYADPLGFSFMGSEFIGSDVIETHPPELKNSITPPKNNDFIKPGADSIELKNTLLNTNDSITLALLLDGDYNRIDKIGRIIGGEIVEYSDKQPFNLYPNFLRWIVLLIVLAVVTILGFYFSPSTMLAFLQLIISALVIVAVLVVFLKLVK